jgi:hypothetical protein
VSGLDRLAHGVEEIGAHGIEGDLVAQPHAERVERPRRVIP